MSSAILNRRRNRHERNCRHVPIADGPTGGAKSRLLQRAGIRFCAVRDVARWPLFGWLAHAAGTIFVDRERKFSSPKVVNSIRDAIAGGPVVVLFPEGTSSDGSKVLPFKSALVEPAVQLRCSIGTGSIEYALDDGSVADEVCYWRDMTLVPHLFNLLFKREIRANYSFSPAKVRPGNRKEIARELRGEIVSIRSLPRTDNPFESFIPRTAGESRFGQMRIGTPMSKPLAGMAARQNSRWQPSGRISLSNRRYIATGTAMWSRGENCLAMATSGVPLEIHPFFRQDTHCSVCELRPPLASTAGVEHRFRVFLPPGYHENTLKHYPVLLYAQWAQSFLKEETNSRLHPPTASIFFRFIRYFGRVNGFEPGDRNHVYLPPI